LLTNKYLNPSNWYILPRSGMGLRADTFFVLPTCCDASGVSCDIDSAAMRGEAIRLKPLFEGVFGTTRVFSPWYTQISMSRFKTVQAAGGWNAAYTEAENVALPDVLLAFETFLNRHNGGRPIILAGHSQGSIVLRQLILRLRKKHPWVLNRLVAAYLIGIPVTQDFLDAAKLPFAKGARDTGVVISYNSMSPEAVSNPFTPEGALVINPVNWRLDEVYASREENLGSLLINTNGARGGMQYLERFADACVDLSRRGIITTAPVKAESPWPEGVLHHYDYMLFYGSLRKNAAERVLAFCRT